MGLPLRSARKLSNLTEKGSVFCFHLRALFVVYLTGLGSFVCNKVELMILQGAPDS